MVEKYGPGGTFWELEQPIWESERARELKEKEELEQKETEGKAKKGASGAIRVRDQYVRRPAKAWEIWNEPNYGVFSPYKGTASKTCKKPTREEYKDKSDSEAEFTTPKYLTSDGTGRFHV
jgi:hypothetical protein